MAEDVICTKIGDPSEHQHFLFTLEDSPIAKVELVGVVVRADLKVRRRTYYVDDGTAVLRCLQFLNTEESLDTAFHIGQLLTVRGTLAQSESNEDTYALHLVVSLIDCIPDPNSEVLHWLSTMQLDKR